MLNSWIDWGRFNKKIELERSERSVLIIKNVILYCEFCTAY